MHHGKFGIDEILITDFKDIISSLDDLNFLYGKKWLITGANGLLGSYLVLFLYYLNCITIEEEGKMDITLILNKGWHKKGSNLQYISMDNHTHFIFKDLSKDFRLNISECDYVIHAASLADPKQYLNNPMKTIDLNVRATRKLLELSLLKKAKRFVFFSSGEIYGNPAPSEIPIKENYIPRTNHLNDRSCYVESKRFSETLITNFSRQFNLPFSIIRPIHVYGPGLKSSDGRVWADFINSGLVENQINILGDGKSRRGFCYIKDYLIQLLIILSKGEPNEIYNIGNDKDTSIEELAIAVKKSINSTIRINILNLKLDIYANSPVVSVPSISKVRNLQNFSSTDLIEGISRTVEWVKEYNNKHIILDGNKNCYA